MEQSCVICHKQKLTSRCIRCHKPVCDECAFKDSNGLFCSRDCANDYQAYKESKRPEIQSQGILAGIVNKLGMIILLVVLAGAVYVYGAKQGWFGETHKRQINEQQENIEQEVEEAGNHPGE